MDIVSAIWGGSFRNVTVKCWTNERGCSRV